jgi:Mg-chelatase subunit ChlD
VEYKCPITPLFEVFRDHIDKVHSSGETCLYDAIEKAGEVLLEFKKTHEKAQLRILCLTDGEDTKSKSKPHLVTGQLQRNGIVLDAIMIAGNFF